MGLFPVFVVPDLTPVLEKKEEKYRKSILWDYEKGDFVRDGSNRLVESSGKETFIQWCVKVVATERFCHLAYPKDIGTETEAAMKQPDQAATESVLERTITEALLVNPRTEYVRGFSFFWLSDTVSCEFTVKGTGWEEISLNTTIGKGVTILWQ